MVRIGLGDVKIVLRIIEYLGYDLDPAQPYVSPAEFV